MTPEAIVALLTAALQFPAEVMSLVNALKQTPKDRLIQRQKDLAEAIDAVKKTGDPISIYNFLSGGL